MINGSDRILYIELNGIYKPLACLTSNSFTESVDFLDTTTRLTGGWKTSRPNLQSFTVDFEGEQDYDKTSYEQLKLIKRNKVLSSFKIENIDETHREEFKGYFETISENASVNEVLSYSGSIKGYSNPVTILEQPNWIFVNENNFTTLGGDSLQFID